MLKFLVSFIITLFFGVYTSAVAGILFYDDGEVVPLKSEWKTVNNWQATDSWKYILGLKPAGSSITQSYDQARDGQRSYKFVLPPIEDGVDYITARGDLHVELILNKGISSSASQPDKFSFGKVYWIGYSMFIPSNFKAPKDWMVVGQHHGSNDSCDQSPMAQPFAFYIGNGSDGNLRLRSMISGEADKCGTGWDDDYREYFTSAPLKRGGWNDIVMRIKFSYTSPGINQVWLNGVKFVNNTTKINAHNDAIPPNWHIGIYGSLDTKTTIYYDEIRIGDASSSYDEVAPRGNATAPLIVPEPGADEELEPPTLEIVTKN